MRTCCPNFKTLLIFFLTIIHTYEWCLRTIFANTLNIKSLDFSPDGQYILTGSSSGVVLLWKSDTLQILKTYTFPVTVWQAVFSKNQQLIAIAGQQDTIHIINTNTFSLNSTINTAHNGIVFDIDFSYDSTRILTCGDDGKTKIWKTSDGSNLVTKTNKHQTYSCQFADNDWYVVGGRHYYQTYDTTNTMKHQFHDSNYNDFYGLRIRPGGLYFIATNADGNLFQSDMNGVNTFHQDSAGGLFACGYTRDSTYFAAGGTDGKIYMYNATNRNNSLQSILITGSNSSINSSQFSYDSNYFIAGDQDGEIYYFQRFCHGCPPGSYPNKTICKLCGQTLIGCSNCINSTVCKSCISGYYIDTVNLICKACSTPMQGCGNCNSSTNCTNCLPGFFLNGLICSRCPNSIPGCYQCSSTITCFECQNQYFVNNGLCVRCNTNIPHCLNCNSSTTCIACVAGYYLNSTLNCRQCSLDIPNCLICSSGILCLSCVSGYKTNSSNLCERCKPECLFCNALDQCYDCVETMYVTATFTCDFCVHPCETCNSLVYCHSCVQGYYKSAPGVCTNCPAGCLSCNTSTRCQSCDVGYYLNSTTHICNKCLIQFVNCRQCTPSTCLVCELEYHLNGSSCAQCSQLIPNCEICDSTFICDQCTAGYYPTGLANALSCGQCEIGCVNCKSATACYACGEGYYLSFFDCFLCSSNCLTCSSSAASACTSCVEGFYLLTTTTGSCISCSGINKCTACLNASYCLGCDVGYFLSSPTLCTLCAAPCTSCKTSVSDCLTCALGYYIYTTGGGTGACAQCNAECSDCSTSASTCLNCVQGYYHNNVTLTCTRCITALAGCSICENATSCIMCADGYYPVGSACQPCSPHILKCLRCNTLGTLCSMCDYGYALSVTNTSCISCATTLAFCEHCTTSAVCQTCKPGYFTNGTSCVPCSIGCINCVNASICENCITTYILVSNGTCLNCQDAIVGCHLCTSTTTCTDCVFGFYLTAPTCSLCRVALPGCEHCSSATTCLQCSVFYQLQTNATCSLCSSIYANCQLCSVSAVGCLDCQVGYYLFNGSCFSCGNATSQGCLKCSSNNTCTECMNGYYLNTTLLCQKCDVTFANCIYCTPSLCLQCESGFYLTAGGVCTACPSQGCQICVWNNPAQCVGCNSRYYLSGSQCLLCSTVMPQCLQCTNSTSCINCAIGFLVNYSNVCQLCSQVYPGCLFCTSSGCLSCKSNYFLNSTDLQCHSCPQYLIGCAYCTSQTLCSSCQVGYYMDNTTQICHHCSTLTGCLYCINESICIKCQQTYFLSSTDNQCYLCSTFIPFCISCSNSANCTACEGSYKLMGGECVQVKGQVMRKYTSIGIKSAYINDTCLKHTLYAREFNLVKAQQNWQTQVQLTLISKNYTEYSLKILSTQWNSNMRELIFYTDNPIADQLSESVKKMPLVKSRLLVDASVDLGFNLKLMMSEKATHQIMPSLQHLGDLYLNYPYNDSQFYQSYTKNHSFSYFIFGILISFLLLIGYSTKLCFIMPISKQRGSIIPHIFALKCAALAIYPTYLEYINFCYGFMTADMPWFNLVLGAKFGNSVDVLPKPHAMYYVNLSLISTYLVAIIVIIFLWICASIAGYIVQDSRKKVQPIKSLMHNFFILGAVIAGSLSLQGVIFNPIDSISANTVFYIVGIVMYFGILIQIVYSWSSRKSIALAKIKLSSLDDIQLYGHLRKLRVFIKATILSLAHLSPLYIFIAAFCIQLCFIALQYYVSHQQKPSPRLQMAQNIIINLSLLFLILINDALIGIIVTIVLVISVIGVDIYCNFVQYCNISAVEDLQIDQQVLHHTHNNSNKQSTYADVQDFRVDEQQHENVAKKNNVQYRNNRNISENTLVNLTTQNYPKENKDHDKAKASRKSRIIYSRIDIMNKWDSKKTPQNIISQFDLVGKL